MAATPPKRKYECSDAILLQEANLNKNLLQANLADFTAEDDTVDAAYITAYELDITEAEDADTDDEVEDILYTKTQLVKDAQKAIAKKVQQVRYYVMQAFPDNKGVQKEFGLDEWDGVRNNQAETLIFLKKMHGAATRYQTQLTAAGFGAARTASILTARQVLEDANDDQEEYRSGRVNLTSLRIQEYNEVYERIARINALAQIVYADDYAMAQQFVFNPSGSGDDTSPSTFIGAIGGGETKTIADLTYVADRLVTVQSTGPTSLLFNINTVAGTPEGTGQEVAAGGEKAVTMAQLNSNADAHILQVKNLDTEQPGAYIVTLGS